MMYVMEIHWINTQVSNSNKIHNKKIKNTAPTTASNEVDERVDHAFDLENLPQNWGGVQENEYIKYLARSQVPAHILMSFSVEQLNKWSASVRKVFFEEESLSSLGKKRRLFTNCFFP